MRTVEQYDKDNRSAFGKLYSPSQKFGVETLEANGAQASIGCYVLSRAVEIAETTFSRGGQAQIFRRTNPSCKLVKTFLREAAQ